MNQSRTVLTDEILVEFDGDLPDTIRKMSKLCRNFVKTYPASDDLWWDTRYALEEYQLLADQLNAQAPDGYYFGGHPTQPQCLGYWPTY